MNPEKPAVLIVDDDSDTLRSVSSQIDASKVRMATCPFGPVAYAYVAQNKPALVLMDARRLYLEGPASFDSMKETSPGTRVVFIDSEGPWTLLMDLPRPDNQEFLINPCTREEVLGVVEQLAGLQTG